MNDYAEKNSPPVDLVVVIDTSQSMKGQAMALGEATAAAVEAAKSHCPSDLRVVWLGIEGTWKGSNFTQTVRSYLTGECQVPAAALRGRKRGELPGGGAQEDGARGIEDLANHFNWRPGAMRAIFYLGDEALEGGGNRVAQKDIDAANLAIGAAQQAGVKVHTYFGTTRSKYKEELQREYARVAQETGGEAFADQEVSSSFAEVLEKVICATQKPVVPPAAEPTTLATAGTARTEESPPPAREETQQEKQAAPEKSLPGREKVYVQDFLAGHLSHLFTLDLVTGAAALVGPVDINIADIAFLGDRLYGIQYTDDFRSSRLLSIELNSGKGTLIGALGFKVGGLTGVGDALYGIGGSQLIAIDPPTGTGRSVGGWEGNLRANNGAIAVDRQGKAYAALTGNAGGRCYLTTLDLTSGAVEVIGDTGFPYLYSIDFQGDELYGVTGGGELVQLSTTHGTGILIARTRPTLFWAGMSIYRSQ
jgi:hypothetical protein